MCATAENQPKINMTNFIILGRDNFTCQIFFIYLPVRVSIINIYMTLTTFVKQLKYVSQVSYPVKLKDISNQAIFSISDNDPPESVTRLSTEYFFVAVCTWAPEQYDNITERQNFNQPSALGQISMLYLNIQSCMASNTNF